MAEPKPHVVTLSEQELQEYLALKPEQQEHYRYLRECNLSHKAALEWVQR